MKIKTINNVVIKPIKSEKQLLPVKGSELFVEPYCNVFLCAKKKSGKSTVIYRILQKCVGKKTKVYIFASTVHRDPAYAKIQDYLDAHNIDYEVFTSIKENGVNLVTDIMKELHEGTEEAETPMNQVPVKQKLLIDYEEPPKERVVKPKYIAPENIFIFDDLGSTLRDKAIDSLLKVNRHTKSKVIISSQYLNDLSPQSRLQLDYVLLFKGLPTEKLEQVYKDTDISIDPQDFFDMYEVATENKYNFFYIDVRNDTFRINFSKEFV